MNRVIVVAAGIILVLGIGLILMQPGEDEAQQREPISQESPGMAKERGPSESTAVAEPNAMAPLASSDRNSERARGRSGNAEGERKAGARRAGIERIANLGYNDFEAKRIRDAWEDTDKKITGCREQIMNGEKGNLEFGAMRACDRSHMNSLYDALGNPEDYRAALVGADRISQVEVGIVDPGSYGDTLGLQPGDQILQWEDQPIFDFSDIAESRRSLVDSDEPVILLILRPPDEFFEIETIGGRTGTSLIGRK